MNAAVRCSAPSGAKEALLQAEGAGRSQYLSTSCSSRSSGSQSKSGSGSRLIEPGSATPRVANPQRATAARIRPPSRRLREPAMLTNMPRARNAAPPEIVGGAGSGRAERKRGALASLPLPAEGGLVRWEWICSWSFPAVSMDGLPETLEPE